MAFEQLLFDFGEMQETAIQEVKEEAKKEEAKLEISDWDMRQIERLQADRCKVLDRFKGMHDLQML